MMKKCLNKIYKILLILILIAPYYLRPMNVDAKAETLADLRDELDGLEQEKKDNASDVKYTQDQINAKNKEIADSYASIDQAKNDITKAEEDIEASNQKIEELSEIVAELLIVQSQLTDQEKYLEYVTGATSMTDLIMRSDAINQLVDNNKETIDEMENLIISNEKLQLDLLKKQEELENNIVSYEAKIVSLESNLSQFAEITMDIDEQIDNQRSLIEYYEDLGCKETENLQSCVEIANNTRWLKPLNSGYVSSAFGYRQIWGSWSFHGAVDVAGNKEGTNVYAALNGTVAAVVHRSSCGGNKVYIHHYLNGKPYTTSYLHLLTYNVKVGDQVTTSTVIGTVGGGAGTSSYDSCSTGAHLHFGVANGLYYGGGPDGYSSYNTFLAKSIDPPGFPSKGGWFNSRTHWFD